VTDPGGRATPLKILVVGEDYPWPANRGGLIRLGKVIEALGELGEVDLFTLYDRRRSSFPVPDGLHLARRETTLYPTPDRAVRWRAAWVTHRDLPLEVAMRNGDAGPRRRFEAWAADHYDVVWFDKPAVFHWLGRPRLGPTIVDIDNLEDEKAMQWARVRGDDRGGGGGRAWLRSRAAVAQATFNAHRWRNLQQAVAARAERVVLCTDTDARRSGFANAAVLPNSYPRPDRAAGASRREGVADPPVILLQGTLTDAPNMDAVEWLMGRVAPRLWERRPEVEIRLVGNPAPDVQRWNRPPAVTVVGRVPDMEPELARADLVVVPLRVGSGTRIKILESFAHRIPVVSTTLGAEGLDVEDGVHLLVADDPDDFAAACGRLLTDVGLRKRLVDAAEDLYLDRYQWASAKGRIGQIIAQLTGPGRTADP
jgi:glycosyltransferase involved in cell wall biosynthesis